MRREWIFHSSRQPTSASAGTTMFHSKSRIPTLSIQSDYGAFSGAVELERWCQLSCQQAGHTRSSTSQEAQSSTISFLIAITSCQDCSILKSLPLWRSQWLRRGSTRWFWLGTDDVLDLSHSCQARRCFGWVFRLMKKREGKLTDEEVSKDTNIAASWPSRFMKNQELVFYGRNIMIQFLYLPMMQSFSFDQ